MTTSTCICNWICFVLFKKNFKISLISGERKRLKQGVVPSVFSFNLICSPSSRSERAERREAIISKDSDFELGLQVDIGPEDNADGYVPMIQENEVGVDVPPICVDTSTQCRLISDKNNRYSIEDYQDQPRIVWYYTGFDDYGHFMMFYQVLGPAVNQIRDNDRTSLTPKDELFLTIMKLRRAKDDLELSVMFKISESSVNRIINTWINFMYFQLKELNIWPEREVIDEFMPDGFKRLFKKTLVILDATETPVQKPSHVKAQSITYSTYKSKNTLKTMVGCSPRGLVTYVSDSYGGSCSDRQIIERSTLVNDPSLFQPKDSIMADRGIMVQDIFATKDVHVNTPTMLKGKSQLEPEDVVKDRRIASKRIHIERVIGLAKTYKILKKDLPVSKIHLGSRITYVCFMMSNFRSSIVNKLA